MPEAAAEILRRVNANLRRALDRFRPEHSACSAIAPQELSDLLGDLLQAADCQRNLPPRAENDSELAHQTSEYRSNLEKLRRFLPDLHRRLLAERARLRVAQDHVVAAGAWAQASKKTL